MLLPDSLSWFMDSKRTNANQYVMVSREKQRVCLMEKEWREE